MEEFVNYVESWEFWFRIVWYSSAIGFGLALGVSLYEWATGVIDSLFNLKFKKDKGEEK